MKDISTFDVLGPIMIGPSSSHTAGAAKIGLFAHKVAKGDIKKVKFYLHGSFYKTLKGHGTDKALLAGILGLDEKDKRIRNAYKLADEKNIDYSFEGLDLGDVHPNSVLIEITQSDGTILEIQGSSIGGGQILINKIDDLLLNFSADKPTIITKHQDIPGVISKTTGILAKHNLNIGFMEVIRADNKMAYMIIELDEPYDSSIKAELLTNVDAIKEIFLF